MPKLLILLFVPVLLLAKPNIAVSYPFIGALVETIAGDTVSTTVLATGNWDPHFVVPRPSLIAKMRRADALIINGAQLEIGWLPPLLRRANNPKTRSGSIGFLNLAHYVTLIQKPKSVDRSQGDVHPDGNPHYHLDPANILKIAKVITAFVSRLNPSQGETYQQNYASFETVWHQHMKQWKERMAPIAGTKILQYHDNFAYFNRAFGLINIGTIEPLPGIPPSSKHTFELIREIKAEHPCCIIHDVYHSTKTAEYIADKTGVKLIIMPHDIGALDSIHDLIELFDHITGSF